MIELSSDPNKRKRQLELHNKIQKLNPTRLGHLYAGYFRSDFEEVIKDTIKNLEKEIEVWKEMLE